MEQVAVPANVADISDERWNRNGYIFDGVKGLSRRTMSVQADHHTYLVSTDICLAGPSTALFSVTKQATGLLRSFLSTEDLGWQIVFW